MKMNDFTSEHEKALITYAINSLKDIHDCLNKLKNLTKPEPKYKPGDKVWYVLDNQSLDFFIEDIRTNENGVEYLINGHGYALTWRKEKNIYPSREALIEAQIEYWQKQLCTCDEAVKLYCPLPHDKHF